MTLYAYFCTLCHHLATSHHLTPGAETVTAGPYRCSHTDCQCEIVDAWMKRGSYEPGAAS